MVSWTSLAPSEFTRASGAILATNSARPADQLGVGEHGVGQPEHRLLVSRVTHRPRGPRLGLVHGLAEVGAQAFLAEQPGAGQGLPQQVLQVGLRRPLGGLGRRAIGEPDGQAVPLGDLVRPVFAALRRARPGGPGRPPGAWCRGSTSVVMVAGQRAASRPAAAWNSAGLTPNRSGSPPTSFSAGQPRPPVEGGVLDPLGQHRAGGLAEPHDQLVAGGLLRRVAGRAAQAEHRIAHRVQGRMQPGVELVAGRGRGGRRTAAENSGGGSPGVTYARYTPNAASSSTSTSCRSASPRPARAGKSARANSRVSLDSSAVNVASAMPRLASRATSAKRGFPPVKRT